MKKSKVTPTKQEQSPILASFVDVEKVRNYLFLAGTWNATLTIDNKLYIEVMKGQMVGKDSWAHLKTIATVPPDISMKIDNYFAQDWSLYK
jgi:hypothetical protein